MGPIHWSGGDAVPEFDVQNPRHPVAGPICTEGSDPGGDKGFDAKAVAGVIRW